MKSAETIKLKRGQRPADWKNHCAKFKEYYAFHNRDWSETECIEAARKYCKSINWQCIEFYQEQYPNNTPEEWEQMRLAAIEEKKSNSKSQLEYYTKRYPEKTLEECRQMQEKYTKENCPQCIEYYTKRYPEKTLEECQQMMNNAKQNITSKQPSYKGKDNPNHKSKTSEFERKSRSPKCIEFYQKKYPEKTLEECQQMVDEHINGVRNIMKDKTKQVKCIEYWLAKGYTKKEAVKIISESQLTFTLDKCIEKYGLEEGTKRYNERQNKWLKSFKNSLKSQFVNGIQSSGIANELFNIIETQIKGQKEFILGKYVFDFVYEHKIIEFNGDYWHANPKIYDKTFINKTNGHTAKEIWSHDKSKIKYAQKHGYEVYTVWESDFRNDPNNVIKKCMSFLTS